MQYIDLEKLKPALEGVEGLPIDVLESILALAEDNDFVDRSAEIDELLDQIESLKSSHTEELEQAKADFEARFRNAFFKGTEVEEKTEEPEEITVEKLLEDILGETTNEE